MGENNATVIRHFSVLLINLQKNRNKKFALNRLACNKSSLATWLSVILLIYCPSLEQGKALKAIREKEEKYLTKLLRSTFFFFFFESNRIKRQTQKDAGNFQAEKKAKKKKSFWRNRLQRFRSRSRQRKIAREKD